MRNDDVAMVARWYAIHSNRHWRGRLGRIWPDGLFTSTAVNLQLTPADLREIETGFSRIEIYGGRMDARQMAQIGKDGE